MRRICLALFLFVGCNPSGNKNVWIYDVYQGGIKIESVCGLPSNWVRDIGKSVAWKGSYYKFTGKKCISKENKN